MSLKVALFTVAAAAMLAPATFLIQRPLSAADAANNNVELIVAAFAKAAGGESAIDKIETRKLEAKEHRGPKLTYLWQKPDRLLVVEGKERIGYDGGSGWVLTAKKRLERLPKGGQRPFEMDANPLRYVHLRKLYSELDAAPPAQIEGKQMDVIAAPNGIASTKFYFDHESHLLARIEDFGETSAYYTNTTDFLDYKQVDKVVLPFRVVHRTNEPNTREHDIRITDIQQNIPLAPNFCSKPVGGSVVLGGKR